MGICKYCQKPAGFLRSKHRECQNRFDEGEAEIVALIDKAMTPSGEIKNLKSAIRQVASISKIDDLDVNDLVVEGWEQAVETAFDDGILTEEEEAKLTEMQQLFDLPQDELDLNGAYSKVVKGAVLRQVLEGKLPTNFKVDGYLPFNLQKSEKLVWLFQDVDYYEEKTKTRYVGGSQGVSVRVAKGLYYRTGAFKGERVQTSETMHLDTGLMGLTNKHIYFVGSAKRFRINYNKVMAFEPFSDGISVQKDAQTAKPQSFITDDGWFTFNLVTNLAKME